MMYSREVGDQISDKGNLKTISQLSNPLRANLSRLSIFSFLLQQALSFVSFQGVLGGLRDNLSPVGLQLGGTGCHRYDFLVCLIGTDLTFSNFLNFYSSLGIDHDPPCSLCSHDLCLFPFLMFHSSHDHLTKRSHYRIMIFSTSEYYYMDASSPSFSISSSITPPILTIKVLIIWADLEKSM